MCNKWNAQIWFFVVWNFRRNFAQKAVKSTCKHVKQCVHSKETLSKPVAERLFTMLLFQIHIVHLSHGDTP